MKSTTYIEEMFAVWPQVEPALRVPHNNREYRQLVKLLDRRIDQVGENEIHPLASMVEVLGVLIEKHEDENVAELAQRIRHAEKENSGDSGKICMA